MINNSKQFYRTFEERFRGSRANIKKKQKVYLPFIQPLHDYYADGIVFDIGCGRGEWLELMQEHGIPAKGIDLDAGMLEAGSTLNLDVAQGDGIAFLKTMKSESALAITAFHVVEHISFEQLQDLISEAQRVLKPGGVLILETPNPENIRVASETFYLDPTHTKPIPSDLLAFVSRYFGFERNRIIRLHAPEAIKEHRYANIAQLLEGVSWDYALVGQKSGPDELFTLLSPAFEKEYGIALTDLYEKFERRFLRMEEIAEESLKSISKVEESAWKSEMASENAKQDVNKLSQQFQELLEANEFYKNELNLILHSHSWKITAPLRYTKIKLQRIKAWLLLQPDTKPGIHTRKTVRRSIQYLYAHPTIRKRVMSILIRFPSISQRLKNFISTSENRNDETGTDTLKSPSFHYPDPEKVLSDIQKEVKKS